jgi:hypothetical protein
MLGAMRYSTSDWGFCKEVITALLSVGFGPSHRGARDLMQQIDSVYWSKKDADVLKGMAMRLLRPRGDRELVALDGILEVLDLYSGE